MVRVAKRLAGRGVPEAHGSGDVAGVDFLDVLALVRVHLQQAADAFLAVADGVVDRIARLEHAGVDANERQLADVRVGHDLERERGEGLAVRRLAFGGSLSVVLALDRLDIDRRRHVIDHGVEHRLHALVLERRAAEHRHDLVLDRSHTKPALDVVDRQVVALEVFVRELVVGFRCRLDHLLPPLLRFVDELRRNLARFVLHAL